MPAHLNKPYKIAAVVVLLIAPLISGRGLAESIDPFPLSTLKNLLRNSEMANAENEFMYDARLPGLKVIVEYTGQTQPLREDAAKFLRLAFKGRGAEHIADLYHHEVRVREQGREYWLPIQDELLGYFRDEVKKGQKFETNVRYLGSSGTAGYVFAMIGFDSASGPLELPRSETISERLAKISIGDDMVKTNKKLSKRLGEPFNSGLVGYSQYYAYVLDKRYETYLIIRDAGEGFRDKVYSIQVQGRPNPELELYKDLRLGDPPSKIREVLGEYSEEPSADGYIRLNFASPRYSVELLDGMLASFMITDDPHYFEE